MDEFIAGIPKAELHVHIEGTLEPEMMFTMAGRNGISLKYNDVDEVRAAYEFSDLQSFLDIYYEAAAVLVTERDFYDLTWAYAEKAYRDGVRHAEIFFDPQTHTARGVTFDTVVSGIHDAMEHAYREFGMTYGLIMCFLRHLSAGDAMRTLEEAMDYVEWITAVGLDSSEVGNPPAKFAEVFDRAREGGFLAVAHAGEEGPPSYVAESLDLLGALRIDHGVRAIEDPRLVERLAAERIPLTMCPLSNLRLKVYDRIEDHDLGRLLAAGVLVTVNSDDPAYFGGYVAANYRAIQKALGLTRDDIVTLARNSFEASFLPRTAKQQRLAEVDAYVASHP